MKILLDNVDKKIVQDENKYYTLIDMGIYIGHRSREWWEEAPKEWRLMFYEDEDGLKIDALVDDIGDYSRIILEKDDVRRVLQLRGNFVIEDSVYDEKEGIDNIYISKSIDSKPVMIDDYLKENHSAYLDGKTFNEEIPSNESVKSFIEDNDRIIDKVINSKNKSI